MHNICDISVQVTNSDHKHWEDDQTERKKGRNKPRYLQDVDTQGTSVTQESICTTKCHRIIYVCVCKIVFLGIPLNTVKEKNK